jgi:voltage-gated potassium channel
MDQKMRWWFRRKFLALLLALGLLVVVYPVLRSAFSTRLLLDALLTVVFLAAFLTIFSQSRFRLLALLLGVPTIVGAWIDYVVPGLPRLPLVVGFHLVAALFLGFTVATILRAIHREETVSTDAIYGAFCGYLLVGLAFGHLYCVTESLNPGSFQMSEQFPPQLQVEARHHFILSYFSFVTLTSVGYGDITPGSGTARSLAVVEAIIGQFYIAVLIGELIGKRVSQVVSGQPSDAA